MGESSGKKKVLSGMIWKFAERFCAQFVTLVISIVLARLLEPDHYGTIAIMMVFINIANVFVNESFSTALIQKKNADKVDFSTIFYFNIVFSWGLYGIIYVAAPWVESFYNMPQLAGAMRVLALKLPISAIYSVQQAYVSRHMLFRKFFFATIIGTVTSAVVGIVMAYKGFGVYALVGQYLTNSLIGTVALWIAVRWRPVWAFSFQSFKGLFNYGWKILATSLLRVIYEDIYSLVIGKKYSSDDLAFYSKGKHYPQMIITNVNSTISSVMLPALSKHQDDPQTLRMMMRRSIKVGSYIVSPLMIGMAVVAEPLVSLVLTDKWLPCVPFLRIACIALLLRPIQSANLQAIKAVGRSDMVLKLETLKRIVGIVILIATMPFGVEAIAWGSVLTTLVESAVNTLPNKKLLGYQYSHQLADLVPNLLLAVGMGAVVHCVSYLPLGAAWMLALQVLVGALAYIGLSIITKNDNFKYVLSALKDFKKKRK